MLSELMDSLFGCSHRRTSFPMTPSRRKAFTASNFAGAKRNGTYVVCLDCGKEFDYNWKEMRLGGVLLTSPSAHTESLPAVK